MNSGGCDAACFDIDTVMEKHGLVDWLIGSECFVDGMVRTIERCWFSGLVWYW